MSDEHEPRVPAVNQADLQPYEWLAFQYLCDELTADQQAEFETALATDPAAAEALQSMVALTQQLFAGARPLAPSISFVAATQPQTRSSSRPDTFRLNRLAALAAGLLLLVGVSQFMTPRPPDPQVAATGADPAGEQLAQIWASSFEEEMAMANPGDDENPTPLATEPHDAADEDWLYSALVSLESTEDWPTEGEGGS